MLLTLYNRDELFSFSNEAGTIYVKGLGNIDTSTFSVDQGEIELGSRHYSSRRATLEDIAKSLERGPQIILPKDVMAIGLEIDLPFCDRMLEIGGGSGGFSIISALAFKVKIKSFEYNVDTFNIFRKNVKRFELEDRIEMVNDDGMNADVNGYETVFIDNPQPWTFLGGEVRGRKKVASLLPTYSQAEEFSRFLLKKDFLVNVHELVDIPQKISKIGMRPETTILYHTGFIVSGKKW